MAAPDEEITVYLRRPKKDADPDSMDRFYRLVEGQLKTLAKSLLRGGGRDHTLQPTLLVDEAFVRLMNGPQRDWESRAHFFRVAYGTMNAFWSIILGGAAPRKSATRRLLPSPMGEWLRRGRLSKNRNRCASLRACWQNWSRTIPKRLRPSWSVSFTGCNSTRPTICSNSSPPIAATICPFAKSLSSAA